MANISIRMDDNLKKQAEAICEELGINLTTATNIFFKQFVRSGGIPFDMRIDPFYSATNQAHLRESIAEYEADRSCSITKTLAELENREKA